MATAAVYMMLKAPLTWGSSPISNGWPTKPWAVRGVAWTVTWATSSGSMSWAPTICMTASMEGCVARQADHGLITTSP